MSGRKRFTKCLMGISGAMGFSFFLLANFFKLFIGLNELAALIQLAINTFVFLSWRQGFVESRGWKARTFTLIGTLVPLFMAGTTIFRVLLPALLNYLSSP